MRLPAYQDLSREQDKINNLPLNGSYLVVGPPGTGKTVMALYRASMLAEKGEPLQILMHSRLLSQYTSDAAEELSVQAHVETFSRWLFRFWLQHYNKRYPQVRKYVADWNEILKQLNQNPPPKSQIPHLVVDEGQDIAPGFYLVAQHVAKRMTVFADENQRISDDNSALSDIRCYSGLTATHKLTRNYRNTKEIADLARHFYTGLQTGIAESPERSGEIPRLLHHPTPEKSAEFILRYEKNHRDKDIGVLVPDIKTRNQLRKLLEGKTVHPLEVFVGGQGSDAEPLSFGAPGIKLLCYASAKGLEFDAVFLPELQNFRTDPRTPDFKMMMYVLVSRARDDLFLMYSGEGEAAAVAALPKETLRTR
jgi:superfamily I DNA/RNA helicase